MRTALKSRHLHTFLPIAPRSRYRYRHGMIYLAVVGVTLIVAVMAAAGMSIARLQLRISQAQQQQQEARLLALSAIESGIDWLGRNSDWRQQWENNPTPVTITLSHGSCTYELVDPDGDFQNSEADPVLVRGVGYVNQAVAVETVTLQPRGAALSCLNSALTTNLDLTLSGSNTNPVTITTNQTISCNGTINVQAFGELNGNAWGLVDVLGTVTGTKSVGGTPLTLPNDGVWDYYLAKGTWIDPQDLAESSGTRLLERVLLSPTTNPYGASNPEGIYVIDCQGSPITLRNSRIVGTLVLRNPGIGSETSQALLMEPAVANYPVLLVDGNIMLHHHSGNLSELDMGVNFNPSGVPNSQGETDSDFTDSYASVLQGLVYVSGSVTTYGTNIPWIDGGLVCNNLEMNGSLQVDYSEISVLNPPPGFGTGDPMIVVSGKWQRTSAE